MNQEAYKQLAALLRLFQQHGLDELLVEDGSFKLRLRRGRADHMPARTPVVPPPSAAPPRPAGRTTRTVAVRSPLIGIFYRAPASDTPAFVEIGDSVEEGQTVCVVEAMKVFNEIKAEWSGRVIAVPAEDGKLVQAGEPLIVLEFPREGQPAKEAV
jgi:acetyl-CoA carboxylase biotin carboxyl carrier protein